jgi:exopolysaccharide biosynthesis protein
MIAGSHILLQAGQKTALPEDRRNPRTALGVDAGGFLYVIAVDGRSEQSAGMNLPELQTYTANLGVTNAINLDGGGSSTLVVAQTVVNRPSDGPERAVPSIIEIGPPRKPCWHAFIRC